MKKKLLTILGIMSIISLSGCSLLDNTEDELTGSITGNTYNISFYSNEGERFLDMSGQTITLESNIVKERAYNNSVGWFYTQTLSNVVTVTIDGKELENCGSTMIFSEEGLNFEVDFKSPDIINSATDGSLGDNVIITSVVNKYKNLFEKSRIVIIQSQLGNPVCAYSGDEVYWEVYKNLPKTTKLMIDGKALYIHRANFQILDKSLLD